MPQAIRGNFGSGSVDVYDVPTDHACRLELLTFTYTTDGTAGVHAPQVIITDTQLAQVTARIWDWNEAGPSMVLSYTFGIGLRPFNCTLTTGMIVPVHLPNTILQPDSVITIQATNAAGVEIAGDTISNVVLYVTLFDILADSPSQLPPILPGYLPGEAA